MLSIRHSRSLPVLMSSVLVLAACGAGSDASDESAEPPSDAEAATVEEDLADDADPDVTTGSKTDTPDEPESVQVDNGSGGDGVVDPVYHHVSAEAPAGSYGPLCNPDNRRDWASGWRISVPVDWAYKMSGGSNSFHDIGFDTPDGFLVTVAWTDSADGAQSYSDGAPVGEVVFDGETVTVSDNSDATFQILSMDYTSQSAGGLVDLFGGDPLLHQVSVRAPLDMAFSQDDATAILTSVRRERCAIFDALLFESGLQRAAVLPVFDGGDPLGKEAPAAERRPFDTSTMISDPYSAFSDEELAYILGFDQATSECFVANLRPTIPTDPADLVVFADPVTPQSEEQVAAFQAVLAGC